MIFSLPDSVTYSKTGMLFGSNLVAKSTDFVAEPRNHHAVLRLRTELRDGRYFLNHKYSFEADELT
jgi:conjugal transfer mating pair stabilization protein TraG